MYILSDNSDLMNEITSLITNVLDAEQHIIGNATEITTREPIICVCNTACSETVNFMTRYLNEKLPLLFIKQQWSNDELKLVETIIRESLSIRQRIWRDEIRKLSGLQGGAAREERMKKLNHWTNFTSVLYQYLSVSQDDFKDKLIEYLQWTEPMKCAQQSLPTLFQRPPALHWTSLPQTDEAQITFKILFPQSYLLKSELFGLLKRISDAYKWQYQYEWSYGALFRIEAAKIAIIQHDPETLELSGRIDNAVQNDDCEATPMKSIWPYLSTAITIAVQHFDQLCLQYTIQIIPFGNNFYEESNAPPRAFDFTQLLISIDLLKRVAYRSDGNLYHLKLEQLFPEIRPKTIQEINGMKASDNGCEKTKITLRRGSASLLLPERVHPTNRGRRVSFGAIWCIPQPSEQEKSNNEPKNSEYEKMIDSYVEQILNETMQQIEIR